ncbi:MAG: restriction endonuclease subunit S [Myxococcota bacterium]|jgi:type I restriction enzyme S subunit|nr:restriction endonuclease subunit S [Myxococcota bacterium]
MSSDVPSGWQIARFDQIANIERGLTYSSEQECSSSEDGAVCVLRIPNVQNQRFVADDLKYLKGISDRHVTRYSVPPGSILMVGSNGNADRVGNCCFVEAQARYVFASFLLRVVPDQISIESRFLYYLLAGGDVQAAITDSVAGTTGLKNISLEMLRAYSFAIPPLLEQKKIAAILCSVDEAIQATQAVIDQTRRVKEGLLQDLLTRGMPGHTRFKMTELGEIPEEWEVRRLGDICELVTSGPRGWAAYYADDGDVFLRSQNIKNGFLDWTDSAFVRPPDGSETLRARLSPRDVLITITGNNVGNVAVFGGSKLPAYASQHVGVVRLSDRGMAPFLAAYLSPDGPGQRQLLKESYGQSKPGLSLIQLRNLLTPVPSNHERVRIDECISSVGQSISNSHLKLIVLQQAKSGLLQDLLTGKVRVSP